MLFGISFTARPGKEAELERLLADPDLASRAASRMGARTDALFVQGNRFTQLYEFDSMDPADVRERLLEAQQAPEFNEMLRRAAPLLSDPFNPDDPTALSAFVQRHKLRLVLEAHPRLLPPAAKPSSARPAIGAAPR